MIKIEWKPAKSEAQAETQDLLERKLRAGLSDELERQIQRVGGRVVRTSGLTDLEFLVAYAILAAKRNLSDTAEFRTFALEVGSAVGERRARGWTWLHMREMELSAR